MLILLIIFGDTYITKQTFCWLQNELFDSSQFVAHLGTVLYYAFTLHFSRSKAEIEVIHHLQVSGINSQHLVFVG